MVTHESEIRERQGRVGAHHVGMEDFESRYRVVASRDRRFEGRFVVAVTSTGVFCRVGCPSRTPLPKNVRFFSAPSAAAAAGFRPCKRCRPDRDDELRDGLTRRALELIAAGVVDTHGVSGLAGQLGIGERSLHRHLVSAVGTSPLQLATSRRVQTARTLIERTSMPLTDIAFASGFNSLRQFNDSMQTELGTAPSSHRAASVRSGQGGWLGLRLPYREPFAAGPLFDFFGVRAIPGVESSDATSYRRSLHTRHGGAVVELRPAPGHVALRVRLDDLADLNDVVRRTRRLLDLDADPDAVAAALRADPVLAPLVAAAPGLRVPGSAEPFEMAVRAILGQQVSVAAARTLAARVVARHGDGLAQPVAGVSHRFPTPAALLEGDLDGLGLTGQRVRSVRSLAGVVASGEVDLVAGDPAEIDARLSRLPGFGPWTRAYIRMRARGDPDAIPIGDLGLRRAMERRNLPADTRSLATRAESWRPWRAYAAIHLWNSLSTETST